jgi:putative endonuclease
MYMHYIYMIKNKNDQLYIRVTQNPQKRLATHNNKNGALFTKNKFPFRMVFLEQYSTLAEARKREIQIKKWRRDKKEFLIKRYSNNLETKLYKHLTSNI